MRTPGCPHCYNDLKLHCKAPFDSTACHIVPRIRLWLDRSTIPLDSTARLYRSTLRILESLIFSPFAKEKKTSRAVQECHKSDSLNGTLMFPSKRPALKSRQDDDVIPGSDVTIQAAAFACHVVTR